HFLRWGSGDAHADYPGAAIAGHRHEIRRHPRCHAKAGPLCIQGDEVAAGARSQGGAGESCHPSIADVAGPIDTVTMYLGAARSTPLIDDILKAKPRRIIFNPGAENEELARAAQAAGIE